MMEGCAGFHLAPACSASRNSLTTTQPGGMCLRTPPPTARRIYVYWVRGKDGLTKYLDCGWYGIFSLMMLDEMMSHDS